MLKAVALLPHSPVSVAAVALLAAVVLLVLALPGPGVLRLADSRRLPTLLTGAGIGLGAGGAVVALTRAGRGLLASGRSWSVLDVAAVLVAGAAVGVALGNLVHTRWWRRLVAVVAVPLFVLSGAAVVNADRAQADAFGAMAAGPTRTGTPDQPRSVHGVVRTVLIPGVRSGFRARPAIVYLPPAALARHPPRLPVVIMMSGEPGAPTDLVTQGRLGPMMDGIARAHYGVAPVVVVPDQLGAVRANPMCVDSRLGRVATYITTDVRAWTLAHLPVSHDPSRWAVGGFSEGGTCSIQFAAGRPDLFGAVLDISGQVAPVNGTLRHTLAVAFGGSRPAYLRASPLALLRAHTPFVHTRALFAVGALDRRYRPMSVVVARSARQAGMQTSLHLVPDVKHNWRTARGGLTWGMAELVRWWRI